MATVFSHPAPSNPLLGCQLSEVSSLPPQPVPFLPTPLSVIQPPQGTVYFQPPYVFPSGLSQPMHCEQPNVPSSFENTSSEGPAIESAEGTSELSPSVVFYPPPPPFSIPFPPPMHPFPLFNPYIRPGAVFFVLPPFPDNSALGNPVPLLPSMPFVCPNSPLPQSFSSSSASASHQSWSTTNTTSQNSTARITPRKDNILSTDASQSTLRFSGNDDYRNFQADNTSRNELMSQNRSGRSLNNYRTKLCINFKNGHCPYGDNCRFIHYQTSDGVIKPKFSANVPAFVPRANAMHAKQNSPSTSLDMISSNRLYSSTPISLLAKGQSSGSYMKERQTAPTGRRVSYRQDFSAGYRKPSVADGPHPLSTC